jgi:hypothetical protein
MTGEIDDNDLPELTISGRTQQIEAAAQAEQAKVYRVRNRAFRTQPALTTENANDATRFSRVGD